MHFCELIRHANTKAWKAEVKERGDEAFEFLQIKLIIGVTYICGHPPLL